MDRATLVSIDRTLCVFCVSWLLLGTGCDSQGDADPDSVSLLRPTECEMSKQDPPAWKTQSNGAIEIRAIKASLNADEPQGEVKELLKQRIDEYLTQQYPQLSEPARLRLTELVDDTATEDSWLEGENCLLWSSAAVESEALVNEVVFLQLNEDFAREIPRYRELGTDSNKSNAQRSGYLTTALLMLESIDSRYLGQTMAVNYERELIQSKLDELTETSGSDFVVLLDRGLSSTNVDAATRTRASLEKFGSIDAKKKADGLAKLDALIGRLQAQDVRAQIDVLRDGGFEAGYLQAEATVALLAPYTEGREAEYAEATIRDLNERAMNLRFAEIDAFKDGNDSDAAQLQRVIDQIDDIADKYGDPPGLSARKTKLMTAMKLIEEVQAFAERGECASTLAVTSFTQFDFVQTGSTSSKRNRRLNIQGTHSVVTLTNRLASPIQLTGLDQSIGEADGSAIVRSTNQALMAEIAGGETREFEIDLSFDNEHPAAINCLAPLPKRTHECRLNVVTMVNAAARHDCKAFAITVTEPVSLMSQHQPDTYSIKLLRDQ